jgi:hypothetical protein
MEFALLQENPPKVTYGIASPPRKLLLQEKKSPMELASPPRKLLLQEKKSPMELSF